MPIYVDADACPVKDEVYRVARRHGEAVRVVANAPLRVPAEPSIELVVVRGGYEAVDDWIAEQIGPGDLVVTADILLADRCLKAGARAIGSKGYAFTDDSIGEALATRAILDQLRQVGQYGGGPSPFAKADRSRFLGKLDEMLVAIRKERDRASRRRPDPGPDPGPGQGPPGGPM